MHDTRQIPAVMTEWLTSERHPLQIDAVAASGMPGLVGMTLCPGTKDPYAKFGAWDRDLKADLQVVRDWGASPDWNKGTAARAWPDGQTQWADRCM